MKANRALSLLPATAAVALALLAASCSAPPPPPPPRPIPRPQPTYTPPPPPPVQTSRDWRDAPITPGNWRWGLAGGASTARFGEGPGDTVLEFRCDRQAGTVLLIRAGMADGPVPLTVTTTSTARPLTARPRGGSQPGIVVALPARDPLLDAIIFSRGRFAVEAQGLAPIYAPTWPEIARVVEDCR